MTLDEKRIDRLYVLLHKLERDGADPEIVAALRWAIFTLEQVTK